MGISGLRIDSPFVAPMSKDYPVPPVPLKASGALLKIGAAEARAGPSCRGPLAIITQAYMGRSACVNCGMCSGFGCHVKARSSSAVDDAAARREDRQLRDPRPISYVREISVDTSGKVTGVVYFDAQQARVLPEGEGGRPVRQRHRVGAPAAAVEVGAVSRTASRTRAASSAST